MKLRLTPKQQMWANIFKCSTERYLSYKNTEREDRELTTVILSLQKGEQFWKELL